MPDDTEPEDAATPGDEPPGPGRAGTPTAEEPKLLTGGNPQIPKGDGEGPVEAYLAAMPGWKEGVGRRLDALIEDEVENLRKGVRWNSAFYGVEGRGWFLSFRCFTKYIKVSFFDGESLEPPPPVDAADEDTRYFHIHEDDELDDQLVTAWIGQAAKLPGWTLSGSSP